MLKSLSDNFRLIEAVGLLLIFFSGAMEYRSSYIYKANIDSLNSLSLANNSVHFLSNVAFSILYRVDRLRNDSLLEKSLTQPPGKPSTIFQSNLSDQIAEIRNDLYFTIVRLVNIDSVQTRSGLSPLTRTNETIILLQTALRNLYDASDTARRLDLQTEALTKWMPELKHALKALSIEVQKAERRTISDLTWLRSRYQLLYMITFTLGAVLVVFGKLLNWKIDRGKVQDS